MHYNGEKEQQQLMAKAVAQLPGHEKDLQQFTEFLVGYMSSVITTCDEASLLQHLIKLSFDELLELILSSLQPEAACAEQINKLRKVTFKAYPSWSGINGLDFGLGTINILRHQDLKTITYLLYPDVAPRHKVKDPDSLIQLYHSFTEQHVREVVGKLRQAKGFKAYADYFPPTRIEGSIAENMSQAENSMRKQEASLRAAVDVAKKIFNHKEQPRFYTFLLRILNSLLRALETETPERTAEAELNQHYAHYKLAKELSCTKQFNTAMMQLLSESIHAKSHTIITLGIWRMTRDRSSLLGRIYKQTKLLTTGRMADQPLLDAWVAAQLEQEAYNLHPAYLKTVNTITPAPLVSQHQLFSPSSSAKKNQIDDETTSEEDEHNLKKTKLAS